MQRSVRHRTVRLLTAFVAVGGIAFASSAHARPGGRPEQLFSTQAQGHDGPHGGLGARRAAAREQRQQMNAARGQRAERAAQREQAMQRAQEAPQPAPAPQAPPQRFDNERPGRMSPEERRALRQQINDAGRDLYRPVRP